MALHLPQIQLLGISAVHGNASLHNTVREWDGSVLCRPIDLGRTLSPALTHNSHTETFLQAMLSGVCSRSARKSRSNGSLSTPARPSRSFASAGLTTVRRRTSFHSSTATSLEADYRMLSSFPILVLTNSPAPSASSQRSTAKTASVASKVSPHQTTRAYSPNSTRRKGKTPSSPSPQRPGPSPPTRNSPSSRPARSRTPPCS